MAKLETFLSARREVQDALEFTHSDPATGLYNWNGLLTRAVEMVADAQRSGRWTGCVAIGPREGHPGRRELLDRIAKTLEEVTRDSDPTGFLGSTDFIVLAPGTDEEGTAILAQRLIDSLHGAPRSEERRKSALEFAAGYYSARDEDGGSLRAQDLVERTMEALRTAQTADAGSPAILPFHHLA